MRVSAVFAIGMLLLAGACGSSSSATGSHDAGTCAIGALGCRCTNGGGCDPGGHCDPALHICVSNIGSGGAGATGGGTGLDAGAGSGGAGAGGTAGSGASGAGGSGAGGTSGASGAGGSATGGASGASGAGGSATGGVSGASGSAGAGGSVDGIGMLPCGSTTCLAPKACCYKYQQVAGQSAYQTTWTCVDPSACATCTGTGCRVTLISCHGAIDCAAGQECCPTYNGARTGLASVKCGQCQSGAICDPNQIGQPCPYVNGQGTCSPSALLPGYNACVYN